MRDTKNIMERLRDLELEKERLIEKRKAEIGRIFADNQGLGISNKFLIGFIRLLNNKGDLALKEKLEAMSTQPRLERLQQKA